MSIDLSKSLKKLRIVLITLSMLAVIFIAWECLNYFAGDSITKAHFHTKYRLWGHQVGICNQSCLDSWLTSYQGEGPNHQVMVTFGGFCIRTPKPCLKILKNLPSINRSSVIERLIFALSDSGNSERFLFQFNYPPEKLREVIQN